jgi:tetratricopeptide (TPR) repeat protein
MRWAAAAVVVGMLAASAAGFAQRVDAAGASRERKAVASLCMRAATLRAAGEESDAVAAYKAALERSPDSRCATKGLMDGAPATLGGQLDEIVGWLPRLLLIAGLGLLALFCVLLLGHVPRLHRMLVRVWGIGRMLSPRLTLSPLSDHSGKAVGGTLDARIKRRLAEMQRIAFLKHGPAYELDFSTPAEDFADLVADNAGLKSSLDKASESSDQIKIVGAILTLLYTLLPTQRLTVSGVVEPMVGACASATLNLDNGGRPIAAATLLGSVDDSRGELAAADFVKLAEPAAVWVQYEVARAIRGEIDRGPHAAVAYALVREGLEKQRAGDVPAARSKFEEARDLDGRNWAASLNLAMTEARLAMDYDRAIEILDSAFCEIQRRG